MKLILQNQKNFENEVRLLKKVHNVAYEKVEEDHKNKQVVDLVLHLHFVKEETVIHIDFVED